MEAVFVHTVMANPDEPTRVRAMSTVIFSDGDSFSVPIVERETGEIVIDVNAAIIDRDMRKLAEGAILADCWALANSNNI